jgi:hypothetical protein
VQLIVSFTNITKLEEVATTKEYLVVQQEDSRSVNRNTKIYNIGAIIAVGYRVNPKPATEFRKWATNILSDYTLCRYVLDKLYA